MTTGLTVLIVGFTKFFDGAWITILLISHHCWQYFLKIRAHYHQVSEQLSMRGLPPSLRPITAQGALRIVLPISGVHRGTVEAMRFACSISSDITAVYVELEPESWSPCLKNGRVFGLIHPVVVPSPYRSFIQPLFDFLEQTDLEHNDGQQATVVLPEFVPAHWWEALLHDQTAWALKAALLYHRPKQGSQRVIIDVPFQLHR